MKTLFKTLAIVAILMTTSFATFAQGPQRPQQNKEQRISREQLAEKQARYIAKQLAFDSNVTDKFVTTYCDCQKEIWALGPRQRPSKQQASEQDNEQRIKERFAMSEKLLNIRQKYYKKYSEFLTQAQIERVYEEEHNLMKRFNDRAHNGKNKNGGNRQHK